MRPSNDLSGAGDFARPSFRRDSTVQPGKQKSHAAYDCHHDEHGNIEENQPPGGMLHERRKFQVQVIVIPDLNATHDVRNRRPKD